jgi:iron complex outermembrane receptor protein
VRAAAKQTRVDEDPLTGSGLDVGQTPGWAVVDIYGNYVINKTVSVRFGIDNLLDKEYAQHLNRSSAFDPLQVQVDEPGISGWVKLAAQF